MTIDENDPSVRAQRKEAFQRLFRFCNGYLLEKDSPARRYLIEERHTDESTIDTFKLGALPHGEDLDILVSYVGLKNLYLTNFVHRGPDQKLEFKFKHHPLLMPIYDQNSEPVGIIGRTLYPDIKMKKLGIPKYWNTPFKKSRNLYGIHAAKSHILAKNEIIIVEGNFDVITSHQYGRKNVVAVSNANLSQHQIVLCARYTSNIKLMFDNDEAGTRAGRAAIEKYAPSKLDIEIKKIPGGYKDVDEYLRETLGGAK